MRDQGRERHQHEVGQQGQGHQPAFRSGARIWRTVKLKPTASMLDTTKQSIETGTDFCMSSIWFAGLWHLERRHILAKFRQKSPGCRCRRTAS